MSQSIVRKCPKRLKDCYFYFHSTCTKVNCEYRHCIEALGTEKICRFWLIGRCMNLRCPYRHMLTAKRSDTPCYHEKQPGGCRKVHCMYAHEEKRDLKFYQELVKEKDNLILPTGYQKGHRSKSADPSPRILMQSALQQVMSDKDKFVYTNRGRPLSESQIAEARAKEMPLTAKPLYAKKISPMETLHQTTPKSRSVNEVNEKKKSKRNVAGQADLTNAAQEAGTKKKASGNAKIAAVKEKGSFDSVVAKVCDDLIKF